MMPNVLHNFWRQRDVDKRLFIVESGEAIGTCERYGIRPNVLVSRQTTIAEALNIATKELTRRGEHCSWMCKIDDDDYYGPGYLAEIVGAPSSADVVGKSRVWVKTRGDRLRLFDYPTDETGSITGPTIACRVGQCADFPDIRPYGEDVGWIVAMRNLGANFHINSERWFCQRRWSWPHPHTWTASDGQVRALAWSVPVFDAGNFNEDVVNGFKIPKLSAVEGHGRPPVLEEMLAYQLAKQSMAA
jgi:hypothetical protein